jgi:lambda repressor-like predicted transcriptional regulator
VIVLSLPDIPQGEENFCEESFQSGISYKTLKNALNTVLLLGKAISYDRWVE